MTVFKRVIIKVIILLVVIGAAGGGTSAFIASRQSTPEYTMDQYLGYLIENDSERAYGLLDQSEDVTLTQEQYAEALTAKSYSLYSSYTMTEQETRRDENGNEYTDYQVEFEDAGGTVQAEETFTVKKQSQRVLGLFDQWKVMPDHCFVQNFLLTVPAGSQVYLNGQEADSGWLVTEDAPAGTDQYQIPQLTPGNISLVIRHPALESVNTALDATAGSADYTSDLTLRESARSEGMEIGVSALRSLYAAAVQEDSQALDQELFSECQEAAAAFVENQGAGFHQDGTEFRSIGVSDFAAQYGDPVISQESGSLEVEMTFSYHYMLREDVTTTSEDQYAEDGTPLTVTETNVDSGNATANLTLSYTDGQWKITSFDIPTVPVTEDAGTAAGTGQSNTDQSTAAGETDENTGTDAQTGQEETESDSPQTETGTEETAETAETTSQTEETSSPDEIEIL